MKRSDHVSLSTSAMASNQVVPKPAEKKLRKRRELNARAAPHHVMGRGGRSRKRPKTTAHLLSKGQSSGSSSFQDEFDDEDEDDEDDVERDKNGYVNLRALEGHGHHVKKLELKKLIGFCHQFCLVFVIFSGLLVLVTLAWLHFSLRSQTRDLALTLHQVLDDKSALEKGQEQFGHQLTSLAKNQSILQDNLTSILVTIEVLTSQIMALNTSMTSILPSLSEAPKLKTIPSEISEIKKDLAQLGSQIIEIDGQVSKTTNDLHFVQQTLNSIPNQTKHQELNINQAALEKLNQNWDQKLLNLTSIMDAKIEDNNEKFKILASNLTEQIQRQELHSKKAWEVLETLTNNVQNVSAKAISNEMLSRANHAEIAKLQNSSASSMNNPSPP